MAEEKKNSTEKKSSSSTTTTKKTRHRSTVARDWRKMMNLLAYVAIALIGVCLLLGKLGLSGNISNAFLTIGNIIAYLIVAVGGWFYIANRKNVWLWVVYFVSLVLIIISYCL